MMNSNITQENLQNLLQIFAKQPYEAGSCEPGSVEHDALSKCEELLRLDYNISILNNINGVLSPYYPSRILIPESHISDRFTNFVSSSMISSSETIYEHQQHKLHIDNNDTANEQLKELILMAKYARCRQRFAVPVIMYKGKFICRSATLSIRPETYGRKVVDFAYDCINYTNNHNTTNNNPSSLCAIVGEGNGGGDGGNEIVVNHNGIKDNDDIDAEACGISIYNDDDDDDDDDDDMNDVLKDSSVPSTTSGSNTVSEASQFSYNEVIKSDIQLLEKLNVKNILDLMVENRKMKYFVPLTSSEKADPENRYNNFNLLALPYPGCEFFSKFRDNNYMAKNLYYNWTYNFIDAKLNVPKNVLNAYDLDDINWADYKKWDIVLITQNYLKLILKTIEYDNNGMLIHCISGWDRTPLFVSLIRLSLWADGLIHQSLTPIQMAYFTLAYDWYLFGHQLPTRLINGEEILFFCFHVLKHITDEEYSINEQRKRTKTSSSSGSSSVIVLKQDCCDDEPSSSSKEDSILVQNIDQDSNDSFCYCDMSSNENFSFSSRSPSSKRSKTSPISVPGLSACRQRQESTSSNGSWQVVTETGSIDSIMNSKNFDSILNNSGATSDIPKDNLTKTTSTLRKQRLNAVRAIFIQSYGKTIGLKFKEGSSINLVNFIGTIADQLF